MRDESEEIVHSTPSSTQSEALDTDRDTDSAPSPQLEQRAEIKVDRKDPVIIRSLIPIVFLGFLVAFLALFLLQWPMPSGSEQPTGLLLLRIAAPSAGDNPANLARRFLDLGIFIITLIGIGFMAVAWRLGERGPLMGLVAVGILGIAYASGTAAYTGPMVSVCGYTIILFGGLVAWLAASSDASFELTEQSDISDTSAINKAEAEATERRTNDNVDNASHSVA
jgi:hypothetical protein